MIFLASKDIVINRRNRLKGDIIYDIMLTKYTYVEEDKEDIRLREEEGNGNNNDVALAPGVGPKGRPSLTINGSCGSMIQIVISSLFIIIPLLLLAWGVQAASHPPVSARLSTHL